MTPQEMENGRRKVARDCRNKLKDISKKQKLTSEISIKVISEYLNEFTLLMTSEQLAKYYPVSFLSYTAKQIDKESCDG